MRHYTLLPALLLAFLVSSAPPLLAQVPTRIPAGLTSVSIDVDATSAGSVYHLELDGALVLETPTDAFTTGTFTFAPVLLAIGPHRFRARSCLDWGPLGGVLCSPFSPVPLDVDSVLPTPATPTALRISTVTVTFTTP